LTGDDVVAAPDKLPPRRQESDRPLIPAGPATRRYARQLGVDLTLVEGSGPGGRIQKEDVEQAVRKMSEAMAQKPSKAASAPAQAPRESGAETARADQDKHGPVRREKMTKIRQTIARRMAESKNTIPHVTNFDDADITDLEAFRQEHKNDFEVKLTHMPFVVKAVVNALAQHPVLNASLDMEAGEIVYKDYYSVGIAVDTDRGLLVPVLREADELSIAQIARKLQQIARSAREGDVDLADLRGGTFTISNLGAIGGRYSTPVINMPEVAILLLGRSRREPRVMPDGSIQVRMIMPLSLSYDHRVVDGADAARFLEDLKAYLESPGKLLLTI
jgi:pyruvate dehydrogenase E2 component (dihydrolipoamide acetyltransferase)